MNRRDLFKKMLPGFVPLFVFIAADEIWGTRVGLLVAVLFGVAQLAYTFYKEKRLDRFTLLDTALIVILGGVSILSDNDIFFKLKPGLVEGVMCIILAVSVFTPANILFAMSKKYMGQWDDDERIKKQMKRTMAGMLVVFSLHTGLVFYSAFYMSKEAWAFISGGLFYILFGVLMGVELIRVRLLRKKNEDVEWVPVLDEKGNITGKATRQAVHSDSALLHPVVHLHIVNSLQEIYLQKRPLSKDIQPGKWDTAVGGHVMYGETIEQTLERETHEEVGITAQGARVLGQYIWKSEVESEMVFSFILEYNGNLFPDFKEIEEGRFWPLKELRQNLGKGVFTPNFEQEFNVLLKQF